MMRVCSHCRLLLAESDTACPHDGAQTASITSPKLSETLASKFAQVQPFAAGQTGVSYLATASDSGFRGLLKVIPLTALDSSERVRIKRELRKQARLVHDGLPRILDGGESSSGLWIFREFIEGESVAQRLRRVGRLALGDALAIVAQTASCLDELQRNGLLHRDVKPAHIILSAEGSVAAKLVDAGVASRLATGSIFDLLGTPAYISPEQVLGKLVSFRSDLYSLGCVLFEMLSGRPPFPGEDVSAVLEAHKNAAPPALDAEVPPAIDALLRSMLAKEPRQRPFSAQQVRRTLEPLLPEGTRLPAAGTRVPTATPLPKSPVPRALPPLPNARAGELPSEELQFEELQPPSLPPPRNTLRLSDDEFDDLQVNVSIPPSPMPSALDEASEPGLSDLAAVKPPALETSEPESLPGSPATMMLSADDMRDLRVSNSLPPGSSTMVLSAQELGELQVANSLPASSPTMMLSAQELGELEVANSPAASPATMILSAQELGELQVGSPDSLDSAAHDAASTPSTPPASSTDGPARAPRAASPQASAAAPAPSDDAARNTASSRAPAAMQSPADADAADRAASSPASQAPDAAASPSVDAERSAAPVGSASRSAAPASARPRAATPAQAAEPAAAATSEPQPELTALAGGASAAAEDAASPTARGTSAQPAASQPASPDPARATDAPPSTRKSQPARRAATLSTTDTSLLEVAPTQIFRPGAAPPASDRRPPSSASAVARPAPIESARPPRGVLFRAAAFAAVAVLAAGALLFVRQRSSPLPSTLGKIDQPDPPGALAGDAPAPSAAPPAVAAPTTAPTPAPEPAPVPAAEAYIPELPPEEAASDAPEANDSAPRQASKPGRPDAAAARIAKAAAFKSQGRADYQAGRYKQAAAAYQKAVSANPADAGAYAGLGASKLAARDIAGAIAGYSRAVRLQPASSGFHAALGRAFLQKGDRRAARREYERALQLDRDNLAARTALNQLK